MKQNLARTMSPFALIILCSLAISFFYASSNLSAATFGEFTYVDNGTEISITDYPTDAVGAVEIPGTIDGKPVTSIGSLAFASCRNITSVTIHESVANIGHSAFFNCSALSSIHIPDSVSDIGVRAFYNCDSLTSVVIPNSVTSIGFSAFQNCSSLTSVTIPASVTSIGDRAFSGCDSLGDISVDSNNSHYSSSSGVLLNKSQTTLIQCPSAYVGSFSIPDTVTNIESYAFYNCSKLTSVNIPDSVNSIGSFAFYSCSSLTSLTLPDSVTSIERSTFSFCSSLSSVKIPDLLISIGERAFYDCSSFTSLTLPDSVNGIGGNAFSGCSSLTSVNIPDSVTSIGERAFYNCSSLAAINIPSGLNSIGDSVFSYCINLTSVIIPGSVTSIGAGAFANCTNLPSVSIPSSVTSIGDRAFYHCRSLAEITLPGLVSNIGEKAFFNCSSLTTVTIPESVNSIGYWAFSGCISLTSAVFLGDASDYGLGSEGMEVLFQNAHSDFRIYYFEDVVGFTSPTWYGYPSYTLGNATDRYIVSNTNDSGPGSLRYAVGLGVDHTATINFAPELAGQTIPLLSGPIHAYSNLTIDTEGKTITIDGNSRDRIFNFRNNSTSLIRGLKMINGFSEGRDGAGIVIDNADLTLSNVTMSGNVASGWGRGGAIYCSGATLAINESTFIENSAGAGSVIGTGSVNLTVNGSTFANNISGYGVIGYGGANMVVNNSTFTGNFGSGEGTVTFDQGGRIQTFNNCTISGNDTTNAGLLLYAEDGNITLNNTIVTGNIGNGDIFAALGVIKIGNNLTQGDPMLAPLGDYGGPTQIMPPLPGSPAIEAGDSNSLPPDDFAHDQRGSVRVVGMNVDIGAVEAFSLGEITSLIDTDKDGIDDRVEAAIFGDLGVANANSDYDGDGSSDKDEIANMTDPMNSADSFSMLSFTVKNETNGELPAFEIILKTFPGLNYRLQSTNNLSSPFTNVEGSSFKAIDFDTPVTLEANDEKLFIRAVRF